jgi:hypothetical protein
MVRQYCLQLLLRAFANLSALRLLFALRIAPLHDAAADADELISGVQEKTPVTATLHAAILSLLPTSLLVLSQLSVVLVSAVVL